MPNGKTHAILTVATSSLLFTTLNYFHVPLNVCLSTASGGLVGLFLTPDLDQAESRNLNAWYAFWWPYGKLMKHRSTLSHFPIVSTTIRLIYTFGIPLFFLWWNYPIENWKYWNLVGYATLGLMAADIVHFFADIITTTIKRSF